MVYSIPFQNVYGENTLFCDYIRTETKFFLYSYREASAFRNKLQDISSRSYDYRFLHRLLLKQNEEYLKNNPHWSDITHALEKGRYCCVVTGQQPGLLGGPLYTIYKALTAIKLAQWVQETLHCVCIPVFWMVSEDHDIAESTFLSIISNDWELQQIKNEIPASYQKQMLSALPCKSIYISSLIERAKSILLSTLYKNDIMNAFFKPYESNITMVQAFARFFSELLKNFPILLLDPADEEIKKAAAPLFFRLTDEYEASYAKLTESINSLTAKGYKAQVKINFGQLPFFFINENNRYPLFLGDNITIKETNQMFPKNHFLKLIKDSPQKISPNVISRPLVQDYILPTIAYVGGAAEISYFAQIAPLYKYLNVSLPIIFPRHSATVIFRKAHKILSKLGISADAFMLNPELPESLVNDKDIEQLFARSRNSIASEMNNLIDELTKINSALQESGNEIKERIFHYLLKFEEKSQHSFAEKQEHLTHNFGILKNLLMPFGKLQERELSLINLLNLEGETTIQTIYNAIDLFDFSHHIYEI